MISLCGFLRSRKSIGEKGLCVKRKNITIVLVVKDFKRRNTQQIIHKDVKNQCCFFRAAELRNQLTIMILLRILLLGRLLCVRHSNRHKIKCCDTTYKSPQGNQSIPLGASVGNFKTTSLIIQLIRTGG